MSQTKTLPLKDIWNEKVTAFFSDRSIDFVLKPDQKDLTPAQKEYLSLQTGFPVSKIVNIRQVHGEHVVAVTAEDLKANTPIPRSGRSDHEQFSGAYCREDRRLSAGLYF